MKTDVLRSSPLKPLAERMRKLAAGCEAFWIATAFLSTEAVDDVVGAALARGARVRLLTGTFGNSTRKATFQSLYDLTSRKKLEAQVWACEAHGNFHGKLYLWRMSQNQGVAWVGSANFTRGGLVNQGELVLEMRGAWNSGPMKQLRAAFEAEWALGSPLTTTFLRSYKEAPRLPPDGTPIGGRRRRKDDKRAKPSRYFTAVVDHHIADDSPIAERVDELLGPTADRWVRHRSKSLRALRQQNEGFVVDKVDGEIAHVVVTDTKLDGNAHVFSYERIGRARPWKAGTLKVLRNAGLRLRSNAKTLGMRWLSDKDGDLVLRTTFGRRPKR